MKTILLLLILFTFYSCVNNKQPANLSVTGKWVHHHTHDSASYHDFMAIFKTDGTYDGVEDGKVVVTGGTYKQSRDVITLNDPSCNPHPVGVYKLIFYAQDSLRFELISDSCDARREGTEPFRFKRVDD